MHGDIHVLLVSRLYHKTYDCVPEGYDFTWCKVFLDNRQDAVVYIVCLWSVSGRNTAGRSLIRRQQHD